MHFRNIIFPLFLLTLPSPAAAHDADSVCTRRIHWHADAMSEGQWNLKDGRAGWANLLSAGMDVGTWRGGCAEIGALATGHIGHAVADDLQDFSNINAENRAFRLIHLGLRHGWDKKVKGFVYFGLRQADEDYFNTDCAALFTGASYGCVPQAGDNFAIGVYPEAALGIHAEIAPSDRWLIKASLYNGTASDRLSRQFRFCPKSDGFAAMGSVTFSPDWVPKGKRMDGDDDCAFQPAYVLGYIAGQQADEETGRLIGGGSVWASIDQPLFKMRRTTLALFATGGTRIGRLNAARGHWAAGLLLDGLTRRGGTLGIGVSRAYYADGHETDFEITSSLPLCQWAQLQPALHVVRTCGETALIGALRLCICLGNK